MQGFLELYKNQGNIGIMFCDIIILITLVHIGLNFVNTKYYSILFNCLKAELDNESFSNETLRVICNSFIKSTESGTESVNTEVIIQKNLSHKQLVIEEILHYTVSLAVIGGLLGTFVGLTSAILGIQGVLQNINGTGNLIQNMSQPIKSMSTAFFTSIFGIIASIILNLTGIMLYKSSKRKFYDEMENYLDNIVYCKYAKNFNNEFEDFKNRVEKAMIGMTESVTETFETGVKELVEKINVVGVDLTQSSENLIIAVDKLDRNINEFNKPINNFKETVDNFKFYYEGFDSKTGKIDEIFRSLVSTFDMTIDAFKDNKNEMIKISEKLANNADEITTAYNKLIGAVDKIDEKSAGYEEMLQDKMKDMNAVYNKLNETIIDFKQEILNMSENLSEAMNVSFKEGVSDTSQEIVDVLSKSVDELKNQSKLMYDTLKVFGNTIKSQNQWMDEYQGMNRTTTETAAGTVQSMTINNSSEEQRMK